MLCFLFISNCIADDTSLGRTPEGVYPIDNDDIEMVDELVDVYVQEGKVECVFTFRNTGDKSTVLMGFPATFDEEYVEHSPGDYEDGIIRNFTAFDGDQELSVQLEKEVEVSLKDSDKRNWYDKWYTFEVSFEAGETKTIRNTYEFKAPVCAMGAGLVLTGYVLDTGAAWKGNIGHAKVIFHLDGMLFTDIENFYPLDVSALSLDKNKLVFEKSDFEPDFNLSLDYWWDPGNVSEDEPFSESLNYHRHLRKNRFFELTQSYNKDRTFEDALLKGNPIEILYLLSENGKSTGLSLTPEIGEVSINYDRRIDLSVIDFSGDLRTVKFEIYSLEQPDTLLYEEEKTIEANDIKGFSVRKSIYPNNYRAKDSFKLKVSAIDSKNNTMNYETDVYLKGNSNVESKSQKESRNTDNTADSTEAFKQNSTDNTGNDLDSKDSKDDDKLELIFISLIGLLIVVTLIQQIRIYKIKKAKK